MTSPTANITSRTWNTQGTIRVKTSSNVDKFNNVTRAAATATSLTSGIIAALGGLSRALTDFGQIANGITKYINQIPLMPYAVPINVGANIVRVGLEYTTASHISREEKNKGLVHEGLITLAGLATILAGRIFKNSAENYTFSKKLSGTCAVISLAIVGYNAWSALSALLGDSATHSVAKEAGKDARNAAE